MSITLSKCVLGAEVHDQVATGTSLPWWAGARMVELHPHHQFKVVDEPAAGFGSGVRF